MEHQKPQKKIDSSNQKTKTDTDSFDNTTTSLDEKKDLKLINNSELDSNKKTEVPKASKKPVKPPKVEDKPFEEFINKHLIPELKLSIERKGTLISEIKLVEGKRPVVGGNCWMIYCEMSEQRKFWLCFNKNIITSDKTILLAESNSEPSIVESFLIDEKKTTLPLLISRVLQRLNGQKWIGKN